MKKLLLAAVVLLANAAVYAQCNKTITWTGSKTEYLDGKGVVQKTDVAPVTVQTTTNHITITVKPVNSEPDVIEGDIQALACSWNEAFKNGKTSFKSVLAKSNGETKDASVSIEAKDGKITLFLELENSNGLKLRVPIDNYKEQG
jgi:hypothetical protein